MARKKNDPNRCPCHLNVNGVELRCEQPVGVVHSHGPHHEVRLLTGDDSFILVRWGYARRVKPCATPMGVNVVVDPNDEGYRV